MFGEYITSASKSHGLFVWVRLDEEFCYPICACSENNSGLAVDGLQFDYAEWPDDPSAMDSHGYIAGELW